RRGLRRRRLVVGKGRVAGRIVLRRALVATIENSTAQITRRDSKKALVYENDHVRKSAVTRDLSRVEKRDFGRNQVIREAECLIVSRERHGGNIRQVRGQNIRSPRHQLIDERAVELEELLVLPAREQRRVIDDVLPDLVRAHALLPEQGASRCPDE